MSWSRRIGCIICAHCVCALSSSELTRAEDAWPSATGGIQTNQWGLHLPDKPVSRRISWQGRFQGPKILGDLEGPGCIRRIWATGQNVGRKVLLRIYFDGQAVPCVEAPLSDFFGIMHDLAGRKEAYRMNTPFLVCQPKNGMACYFPMPFSKSARVEIDSPKGSSFTCMIDWHEYPGQEMKEPMRFCARWRREAPCRDYADDFIMADADGPGQLVGFVYAVDMLQSRHGMRWSHAGADNIYIDGEGSQPAFMRGVGGEDTFGASYSGGDYVPQTSLYSDMPYYIQKDYKGDKQKLVGYRFFVKDEIHFDESIHIRFACRAHDISAMVYWYSAKPVRPYFEIPPVEKRMPGSKLLRGEYDLPLPDCGAWWLAGPFSKVVQVGATDTEFDPNEDLAGRKWVKKNALRGFVEFNHVFRPDPTNDNSPTIDGWAVARCTLNAPDDMVAKLRIAWDDRLLLKLNGNPAIDLGSKGYLQSETVDLPLSKGKNVVLVWLSNQVGNTRGAWNFSFLASTPDGNTLLPQAEGDNTVE